MTTLITQNSLLLTKLVEFYNKDGNMERILPIINGESMISLRLIDWFATNYSKKNYTVYPLKMKNGDEKRFKVYIDPYSANSTAKQYYVVGYKGTSPYDAGIFYCPYVPLQMVRAVGQDTFQPKIGFKTRYGLVANPFAETGAQSGAATAVNDAGSANSNRYYQKVQIANLM